MSDQVWITDQRFLILDVVVRILTQDRAVADRVSELLADFETTNRPARTAQIIQVTGGTGERHRLYRGCNQIATTRRRDTLLASLISLINQTAVEATKQFAVHAAVVACDAQVLAFPAESGAGKTTLAAAAILSGYDYVSDEALVLDGDGYVLTYPKPLAFSRWSAKKLGITVNGTEVLATAADLGGQIGRGERLTHVVIAEYGHHRPELEPMPRSQAVAALIRHSFNHYKAPERAFRIATAVAREVDVWHLSYNDPTPAVQLVADTLT